MTREEIKNIVRHVFHFYEVNSEDCNWTDMNEACGEILKALEREPNTGHWIENAPECQNIDPPYICSECGNMHLRKTNYCDQCGAKMIEAQEGEE